MQRFKVRGEEKAVRMEVRREKPRGLPQAQPQLNKSAGTGAKGRSAEQGAWSHKEESPEQVITLDDDEYGRY